jgi:hypothetical protein
MKSKSECIFKNLFGKWKLSKFIFDHKNSRFYIYEGSATYSHLNEDKDFNNNILKYREDLILINHSETNSLTSFKEYIYYYDSKENKIIIYFNNQDLITDTPYSFDFKNLNNLKVFLKLDLFFRENESYAKANHLCNEDKYKAYFIFSNQYNDFKLSYDIKGPRKDNRITNLYEKIL